VTTNEAIETIREPNSTFGKYVEAAGILAETESTPLDFLVECLFRKGLPAEIAAMKLYIRTNRSRPKTPGDFISDPENWKNYLKELGIS
jgi:hypothetical protein